LRFNAREERNVVVAATFVNTGSTPAYETEVSYKIEIARRSEPCRPFSSDEDYEFRTVIGHGVPAEFTCDSKFIAREEDVLAVINDRRMILRFRGTVRYTSIGRRRHTHFCFQIPHGDLSFKESGLALAMSDDGNSAD
jgi:hypothetical protein